ncbi:hypothetical protein [Candidatus Protochlamydia phocaeensis]|uniref:hypothetical protein n=1 Tax=Candidatus Protochlamydia phocaeensis TaxID=1414722 RepID=UPI0008387E3E|nr:hypothetical protein [Candidatus Protochlamydia phocaeensis]
MNISFASHQIESLLINQNQTNEVLNSKFKLIRFKEELQKQFSQLSEIRYESTSYQELFYLYQNIRQLRLHNTQPSDQLTLIELEELVGKKVLQSKSAYFGNSLSCLKSVQAQREKQWAFFLNILGRGFRIKEPFSAYENLIKKGISWQTCRSDFNAKLKEQLEDEDAKRVMSVVERTYAIFRQIHLQEEKLILDYMSEAIYEIEEKFSVCHEKIEDKLLTGLNEYVVAAKKDAAFRDIRNFFNFSRTQSKTKDRQAYLLQGICIGATLNHIKNQLEGEEQDSIGMQISPQARFYQACHIINLTFLDVLNPKWQNFVLRKAFLNHQLAEASHSEAKALTIQKEELDARFAEFERERELNAMQAMFPSSLIDQLEIKFVEIIGFNGALIKKKISTEAFITEALDRLVEQNKDGQAHFILNLEDSVTKHAPEPESQLSWEQAEERALAILGADSPPEVQRRVQAALLDPALGSGHAVYISLSADYYEFQDPNVSDYKGLKSSNLENFKLMLLAWFSRSPYQTIAGLYRVLPKENASYLTKQ